MNYQLVADVRMIGFCNTLAECLFDRKIMKHLTLKPSSQRNQKLLKAMDTIYRQIDGNAYPFS